jgi:indolepyruvate ferredoxin oxidoreductase
MKPVSLDDKFLLEDGQVFLSGAQMIVRLALDQHRRDARAGLRTGGFISGYRGSPLGGVDTALWQAAPLLSGNDIHFEPGLNEEIAATAVSGSQQVSLFGSPFAGVFGIWYGKNPGVDRAADALKHANAVGTSALGGALAIAGDDPGATSSSLPNQCDQAFIASLIPVLSPASLAEVLSYGLIGIGLSRYSGLWVGLKTVADTIECTASIGVSSSAPSFAVPNDFELPPGGLNARWPDERWDQDLRLLKWRLPAARAFARTNRLDRIALGGERARMAIVTSGKAFGDVMAALAELGIDENVARSMGLIVFKVGMVWPLEPDQIRDAVEGLEEVIVVEERRAVIEPQLKDLAYNWPADRRPRIVGKLDETAQVLFPEEGELSPALVAVRLAKRLERYGLPPQSLERWRAIEARRAAPLPAAASVNRIPHFCSGCPHARSTRVPAGSTAIAGIGCHSLRVWMPDSQTMILPQMGGEGASWLGIAPFTPTQHVFQNLGDGTYAHSGSLSIRAAIAAKRNMTFRILYNEATAMTGGQPIEGGLSVAQIVAQVAAEGVRRIAVISDEPAKYGANAFPAGATTHHRDELDFVQRELREWPGISVIVYDQVCATEKRRRRKRGLAEPPAIRPFINERVCEGCGDCGDRSNCASILPVDTPFGRKRVIDQSSCNADMSCITAFCPSIVTVEGGALRRPAPAADSFSLPPPPPVDTAARADIIAAGIGGTGVMTIGAVAGMAAHIVGRGSSVLDNTGIARKGGAASSHIRLAPSADAITHSRIPDAGATLILACDVITSSTPAALAKINRGKTHVIANSNTVPTLNQRLDPDNLFDAAPLHQRLRDVAGAGHCDFIPATDIAECVLGDAIYANMVMFGFAYQKGFVPLPLEAIDEAISLNGTSVKTNKLAFAWGRRAAHDPAAVAKACGKPVTAAIDHDLDALITRRAAYLTDYQDAAYAQRYRDLVARVRAAEAAAGVANDAVSHAVALSYFRLLSVKDEYEVARLFTDGEMTRALDEHFTGPYTIRYHMAPPFLARPDKVTGRIRKWSFGPWVRPFFTVLAQMRRWRGSWLDVFGRTAERRHERQLIADYEALIASLLSRLNRNNAAQIAEIAALHARIRGFGYVKTASVAKVKQREAELLAALDGAVRQAA